MRYERRTDRLGGKKGKPRCLPVEAVQNTAFPSDKEVFFYDERENMLYSTTRKEVLYFVKNPEPWDQTDACVFDKGMNWVTAVTHGDAVLCSGDMNM